MGTGKLSDVDLDRALGRCAGVAGDFAEVGVYQGHLFTRLVDAAATSGRTAHAFDTFTGMAEPGALDDAEGYGRGAMSPGGRATFAARLPSGGAWELWPGEVPLGFIDYDHAGGGPLAFAYIDVDHFAPTLTAAVWCWNHLAPGGVLAFDDYFPERRGQAAGATGWFLACVSPAERWENGNRQVFVVKP